MRTNTAGGQARVVADFDITTGRTTAAAEVTNIWSAEHSYVSDRGPLIGVDRSPWFQYIDVGDPGQRCYRVLAYNASGDGPLPAVTCASPLWCQEMAPCGSGPKSLARRGRLHFPITADIGRYHGGVVNEMHRNPRVRRVAVWVAAVCGLATFAATPASANDTQRSSTIDKIDNAVLTQITGDRSAEFFVLLKSTIDNKRAASFDTHAERTRFVFQTKKAEADRTQTGLRRLLADRKADFTPYWVANAIKVTGDRSLLLDLAARGEVQQIVPNRDYSLVKPAREAPAASARAVEWNLDRIQAPEVWETFGDRGEGIVVGTIDTGAQFDHPAIARQYRGAEQPGAVDHAYSWYDPSQVCGVPSVVPCDNMGHGTHVLGTITGDDGQGNQTGVAPGASWIAAKGCETGWCSTDALLASGQWLLAPTDLDGDNPRPDLAPHVINNSWGGLPGDPLFRQMVGAWVAAGIFPVFANGNSGPGCGTAISPGDYPESYAVGAFDQNNMIAPFSSRGASTFGVIKPDVAAPGVNIRSSVPGGDYAAWDGTSMATPHVTATVALLWSVAPTLVGSLTETRELLDGAAVATDDQRCGGTPEHNNVWGNGRLDAFAAVNAAPRGPVGTLRGVVRAGGEPLAGADVRVEGPLSRKTRTNDAGEYQFRLSAGEYDLTVGKFGYLEQTTRVTVTENETTTRDLALAEAPRYTVSGQVRDADGEALAGATVSFPGTPLPVVTTDDAGAYRVSGVPEGHFDLVAESGDCLLPAREHVHVTQDAVVDLTLPAKSDAHGHVCAPATPSWTPAGTLLPLSGWEASTQVALPFPVNLYGQSYTSARVTTEGYLDFTSSAVSGRNTPVPSGAEPNTAIYAFWDDFIVDNTASVWTQVAGTAPNRKFVVEWRNVTFTDAMHLRVSFEVVLAENGRITLQYQGLDDYPAERGGSATVGIENETGDDALQYTYNKPVLSDDTAIELRVPDTGLVRGTVTDGNDRQPVPGATVAVAQSGVPDQSVTADQDGRYQVRVKVGDAHLRFSGRNYAAADADVRVDREDGIVERDAVLRTGRLEAEPAALEIVVPPGETRKRTVTLANTGGVDVAWEAKEAGGAATRQAEARAVPAGGTAALRTTQGLPQAAGAQAGTPARVLRSWPVNGLQMGWGVGYQNGLWISDQSGPRNGHFTEDGVLDGMVPASWAAYWTGDLAHVPDRNLMCQVNVGGDNGIYCWNPENGGVVERITGSFPWTAMDQRGLAYRPDDDTFYIGGWQGIIYHIRGLSHDDPGQVLGRCSLSDPNIAGLGWNSAFGVLWASTNSSTDTIYGLHPDTCQTVKTVAAPDNQQWNGAGLETDPAGNIWTVAQGSPSTAYQVDAGVPDFNEVPWLRASPGSSTLKPGASGRLTVEVDASGLAPGTYGATVLLSTTSGRTPTVGVPVKLVVTGYQVGVNAGGRQHRDGEGDAWGADRAYTAGGYGYLDNNRSEVVRTTKPISGTGEQPLLQNQRTRAYEYRFDNVPAGVYAVDLRFAELRDTRPNTRLFDVIAEDGVQIPALDVANEAGSYAALHRTVYVTVTDGQLNVRLISRRGDPIINAIRVTHRPDRTG